MFKTKFYVLRPYKGIMQPFIVAYIDWRCQASSSGHQLYVDILIFCFLENIVDWNANVQNLIIEAKHTMEFIRCCDYQSAVFK